MPRSRRVIDDLAYVLALFAALAACHAPVALAADPSEGPATAPVVPPPAPRAASPAPLPDSPYAKPPEVFKKLVKPPPRIPLDPPLHPLTPEEVTIGPILESLEGVGAVMVRAKDNQVRAVRAGEMLEPGDSFQTGEKGSARVAFEKGVQVLVASNSVLTVNEDETPTITLEKGEARSVVESGVPKDGTEPSPSPSGNDKPYKFFIRSRSATMGVRGTDFVVLAEDGKSSVHTLTGIVDIGRDLTEVKTAQGVPVTGGQYSQVEQGRRPIAPEHYDVGEYLKDLNERNPTMERLWNEAARDARSGRLKEQFQRLRKEQANETNLRRGLIPSVLDRDKKGKDAHGEKLGGEARAGGEKGSGKPRKRRKTRPKIPRKNGT